MQILPCYSSISEEQDIDSWLGFSQFTHHIDARFVELLKKSQETLPRKSIQSEKLPH